MIRNMRDLGGIRTTDGRSIRKGMLIRSARLNEAEERDLRGISTVIDLRTSRERSESPDVIHGREYLPIPVFDEVKAGVSHEKRAENRPMPDMADIYRHIVERDAASFREILTAIMSHDYSGGAVLWHCSEGKDRCGLTAALVLEALGADRETIMADYLKTNEVNIPKAVREREKLEAEKGKDFAERVYRALIADERYLLTAWEAMGDDYLTGTIGIDSAAIDAFRETVLEDV